MYDGFNVIHGRQASFKIVIEGDGEVSKDKINKIIDVIQEELL